MTTCHRGVTTPYYAGTERIELGDALLIAEEHLGIRAEQLARMDHVVALMQAALAAPFAGFGDVVRNGRAWTHGPGGFDETATMIERIAGAPPPMSEPEFIAWVSTHISSVDA